MISDKGGRIRLLLLTVTLLWSSFFKKWVFSVNAPSVSSLCVCVWEEKMERPNWEQCSCTQRGRWSPTHQPLSSGSHTWGLLMMWSCSRWLIAPQTSGCSLLCFITAQCLGLPRSVSVMGWHYEAHEPHISCFSPLPVCLFVRHWSSSFSLLAFSDPLAVHLPGVGLLSPAPSLPTSSPHSFSLSSCPVLSSVSAFHRRLW